VVLVGPRLQERHSHRGIRKADPGSRRQKPLRSRRRSSETPAPTHPDDLLRVHPRCRSTCGEQRCRARKCARRSAPRSSSACSE
jgi:hypothetical protein